MWTPHLLTTSACNETPIYVDLFKTGKKILVMGWNPPKDDKDPKKGNYDDRGEMCYFLPGKDPTQPWRRISISGPPREGQARSPAPAASPTAWGTATSTATAASTSSSRKAGGSNRRSSTAPPGSSIAANITDACADMYTYDMTGTGKADILSTSAHNYGFWWSQQKAPETFVQRALFRRRAKSPSCRKTPI